MGVENNLSGPVWVMEWTAVIVIILRIPKKKKRKKKKKKTAKQNKGKQRGRAAQQKIKVQSNLFHCINLSAIKTNDSPFRLLSSFPVKS